MLSSLGARLGLRGEPFAPSRAYYINLDRSTERRKLMEAQLPSLGLPFSRWPAIESTAVEGNPQYRALLDRGIEPYVVSDERATGTIGCYVSHVTLLEHLAATRHGQVLVFEDDVVIEDGFLDVAGSIVDRLPRYDLVLFDCHGSRHPSDAIADRVYEPTRTFPHYRGSHALLFAKGRARHAQRAIGARKIMDIDGLYLESRGFRSFVVYTDKLRAADVTSERYANAPLAFNTPGK